jgi:hypothetical protein
MKWPKPSLPCSRQTGRARDVRALPVSTACWQAAAAIPVLFADWQKIEAAEVAAARAGFAREKLVRIPELMKASGH